MEDTVKEVHKVADYLVRALVDSPQDVLVLSRVDGRCVLLVVTTADGDIGQVIGKKGRTARNLRGLLAAVARKHRLTLALDIAGYAVTEDDAR